MNLAHWGFNFERGGAHLARPMMLNEMNALLAYVNNPNADKAAYLKAIDEENCLGKRSGEAHSPLAHQPLDQCVFTHFGWQPVNFIHRLTARQGAAPDTYRLRAAPTI
jgi:hypothetical protein